MSESYAGLLMLMGFVFVISIGYRIIESKSTNVKFIIFLEVVFVIIMIFTSYSLGRCDVEQEYQNSISSESQECNKIFDSDLFSIYISFK